MKNKYKFILLFLALNLAFITYYFLKTDSNYIIEKSEAKYHIYLENNDVKKTVDSGEGINAVFQNGDYLFNFKNTDQDYDFSSIVIEEESIRFYSPCKIEEGIIEIISKKNVNEKKNIALPVDIIPYRNNKVYFFENSKSTFMLSLVCSTDVNNNLKDFDLVLFLLNLENRTVDSFKVIDSNVIDFQILYLDKNSIILNVTDFIEGDGMKNIKITNLVNLDSVEITDITDVEINDFQDPYITKGGITYFLSPDSYFKIAIPRVFKF
jgi:hypothetical protein